MAHELFAVAAAAAVCILLLARFVPAFPRGESVAMGKQARALGRTALILVLLTTVFGFGGVFAGFTYISPFLQQITGFSEKTVSPIMLVFGIGSAVGNWIGGRLADWCLMPTLFGSLTMLVMSMAVFSWAGSEPVWAVILVLIWGISGFAMVPTLNMLMLKKRGKRPIWPRRSTFPLLTSGMPWVRPLAERQFKPVSLSAGRQPPGRRSVP
ncbi:hypothetical protein PACILC2_11720 [Paenibacillus cisolokensis]|uniref:Major facilitator superfamily (MFS) profile domain-containing protein n=1 Tax=Paenibacillus cisolokensis TaxID=1658519 RepID=A0ABQ4N324_9BACL|nr:hypothetical protein PACILC2_11720 [Paenibacillus cisolokensis]